MGDNFNQRCHNIGLGTSARTSLRSRRVAMLITIQASYR